MFPEGLVKGRQVYITGNGVESWYFQLSDEEQAEVSKCGHWNCGVGYETCLECKDGIMSPGGVWNKYHPEKQGDGGAWVIPVCVECGDISTGLRSRLPDSPQWVCERHSGVV